MEPERKIEKLLRAFAKKRRADAGEAFKLHPATRRLLQDAVARQAPRPGDAGWLLKFLGGLRPGFVMVAGFAVLVFMGAALLLPGLSKAKNRAQMASAMGNLKQIGMATRQFAEDNRDQLPESLAEIARVTGTNQLFDPASGQPFVYVAGGRSVGSLRSDSVLAYSPADSKSRAVLFADGHVEAVNRTRFSEITNRGLIQLASADASARRELATTPAATPMLAASEYGAAKALEPATPASNFPRLEKNKSTADGLRQKEMTGVPAAGAVATTVPGDPEAKSDRVATASGLFFNANGAATNVPPGQAGNTQTFVSNGGKNSLQQVFKNAAVASKVAPVLANFQFNQSGTAISVVDNDGSVYRGYLMAGETPTEKLLDAAKKSPGVQDKDAAAKSQGGAAQNYFFRVAGTNRSLNQNVVFTGNVLALTNPVALAEQNRRGGFGGGSGGGNLQLSDGNASPSQLGIFSNSRIQGTAVINTTNSIEINAVPAAP